MGFCRKGQEGRMTRHKGTFGVMDMFILPIHPSDGFMDIHISKTVKLYTLNIDKLYYVNAMLKTVFKNKTDIRDKISWAIFY